VSIINDGHSTRISFALNPGLTLAILFEKEVAPPGMDGGGANDITTMHNTTWRTFAPKKLITLSEVTLTVAYDPIAFDTANIPALINKNGAIELRFPNAFKLTFYGWLDSFKPNKNVEGGQPTAEITVIPSNLDAAGAEIAPVYAAA